MKRLYILLLLCLSAMTVACAQDAASRYTNRSVLADGKWVKIRVDKAGVYQLTNQSLRSMGFSNPDRVRLYGLNLEVLPESAIENISDDLVELPLYRTSGKVLFYGRGTTKWTMSRATATSTQFTHTNNPYSTGICYFLTENTDSLPREFEKFEYEVAATATTLDRFPEYALIETDEFSFINTGRTFFEAYDYANGNARNYTLRLPGIVGGTAEARIAVQFCAAGTASSTLNVAINDSSLGNISFGKLGDYEYGKVETRTYTLTGLQSENNTVRLTHNRAGGINGHLDYIRASYLRSLDMTGKNELLFRPYSNGSVNFRLSGGKEETVVWHVNNAEEIEEVAATYDATDGSLTIPFTSSRTTSTAWRSEELVAVNPSATFPAPTVVGTVSNQNLHGLTDIDFVIVVPANGRLTQQAQRLADAHTQRDSMHCAVVRADHIYNEFSSGTPDATAIRRFMKMLYDRTRGRQHAIRNLCLFGDGVWDNRMVTSSLSRKSPDDYLLCYESENSVSHTQSYVLEDYYALVDDNASTSVLGERPRIGVGRIPTSSSTEARDVVSKLITYINNEQVGAWKNTIAVLCDDGNDNIHMADGDSIVRDLTAYYPDYKVRRIYWDTYARETSSVGASYPSTLKDIDKQMQDGALVFNYTGHGAAYCLSHEQVMRTENFANWNSPRLPLWVTAACDVAPFDMNMENIGEVAVLNPNGAALGILSTARTVYSGPNRDLNRRFMRYVLASDASGRRYSIGEALALAKTELVGTTSSSTNRAHFVFLGDPAIKLATPTYKVEVDRINDTYAEGTPVTVGAGGAITVTGHVVDEDGNLADNFNGAIYPTIMDNIELVVCKNNPIDEKNGNTSRTPYQFYDRLRTLYTCADSVSAGRFTFTFPIPLDNNYSGQAGLISLYAANESRTVEANGSFTNFLIHGTSAEISTDTIGPDISIYLNSESFRSGDVVNETPMLIAYLKDNDGINMTGSGVGHDITAIIDNQEALTYSLNSYFAPTMGSYTSGTVQFSIPELSEGHHSLTLRAFDVLNNPATATIDFYVNVGKAPQIFDLRIASTSRSQIDFTLVNDRPQADISVSLDVYDITGRRVWGTSEEGFNASNTYTFSWNMNETDTHLTPGIYIVQAGLSTAGGPKTKTAKKFVVLPQ